MDIIKHLKQFVILWFVFGMCYATAELLFRGFTYVQMIGVGGLAGVLVGLLDCRPSRLTRRMWQQCVLGTLITAGVECASGMILNRWMHLNIWDYSKVRFNFQGQVCLRATVAWFFLMPFAIYLDDWLRWKLFSEPKPKGTVITNYVMLFSGR